MTTITLGISNNSVKDVELWHRRLGHMSESFFFKILFFKNINRCKISHKQNCMICPQAKQQRDPFPVIHSKSVKPFELLHIDTWGLSVTKLMKTSVSLLLLSMISLEAPKFIWLSLNLMLC